MFRGKPLEEQDDYDEILNDAVREYKRKVLIKKIVKTIALLALIIVVLYRTSSSSESPRQQLITEAQEQK